MPRSTRRRSRKNDQEERDRSDSVEDPRAWEQEDRKASVRDSKGLEQHKKRLPSALAKLPNAGEVSGPSVEGQRKRKGRGEQEAVAGDERWGGGGEDDRVSYYDSKKSRSSDGDAKGKSTRKFEESGRSNEVGRRKSEKGTLLEEYSAGEHHGVKERAREHEAEKLKESKQALTLKEDSMDQQYKTVKDRSRDHGAEKGDEDKHDAPSKVMSRSKEVKTQDPEGNKSMNKCNGTDGCQFQDEFHDVELEKNGRHRKTKDHSNGKDESQSSSRDRQTMPRDVHIKIDGCYEQQHRDEKFKDEIPRGVEKRREGKYKDERCKSEDRHKRNNKSYKDDRPKEEERHRDERYKEERSRNEDRHRDGKYKEERSKEDDMHKDERYKEKPRAEEKSRNERSDNSSREKHRDDISRNHRHQDGGSWDVRSSKDNTRDRSLEKHYKEEHNYSESRYNKNRLHDIEGDTSVADHRYSKYRDDNKGKKRSYDESANSGDLEPRNVKEHHGDATKHRSEVGSFVSSADRRREYEKVDSRRRDYERKSPTRSSTYPVREQSRHFPKQEESSPREYGAALGRHKQTSDLQSVDGQSKTDGNSNESSLASRDGRSLRSDGRPIHFNDRPPSTSDRQVPIRSNLRHSHDTADDSMKKGNPRRHELLLNRQATENYQSASPGHLHPPPDRSEMDSRRYFDEDNRSQIRERRSSSRSRRSGTVDSARGHGNTWNNPSSWPSPVHNDFGPFQHGPPLPGFHPAVHQFPQSLFGMRPSMDMNHTGVPYPLHGHPESFSHCAQPFPWHNPAEDPYLPRLPGWDANRKAFEEYSHGYDRQELGRNKDPDFQQQPEVPFSSHTSDKPSLMQVPGQNRSEQSNTEISKIKTADEISAEKTGAQAPKYKSERKPGPSNVKLDSQFCSNYFKRLDISTDLSSPELYKKCITMMGELDPAGSCKRTTHRRLKNNKDEHVYQAKGSNNMIRSIFSGKTTSIFKKAMALYSSCTGSMKFKTPTSSSQPNSEELIKQASVDMVEEGNVTVTDNQALPHTDMCDDVHNNDQPHRGADFSIPAVAGLAKDCISRGEDRVGSDSGDTNLHINHSEGHACDTEQQQVPSNGEGELPHDAKALQPCCNAVDSITEVRKEQFSGVISDAAFASGSQACEDVMPGCRVNLNRIPCSPGST